MLTYILADIPSDFTSSLAGTWADDVLAEQDREKAGADLTTIPGHLAAAANMSEERLIQAGQRGSVTVTQTFDQAWENAKDNP